MDPINILTAINIAAIMAASFTGAKKGLKSKLSAVKERPAGFLQYLPPNLSALLLLMIILGLFQVGTADYTQQRMTLRLAGLAVFVLFSWLQISTFRSLGEFYSQDMVIMKNHMIVKKGFYKYMRHPMYLFQMISDLGAILAVLSYPASVVLLIEIPLLIMRAKAEDIMLARNFGPEFEEYRKQAGFMWGKISY